MIHFKKIIASVLAISLLTIGIAGCGHESATEIDANSDINNENSKEPVTITFIRGQDPTNGTKSMIAAFEAANPNIKVNYQEVPTTELHNTLITSIGAHDSSIDVMSTDVVWTAEFAASGMTEPLDDYMENVDVTSFLPATVSSNTYNGKMYSLPMYTDGAFLYYRKDLVENPPETWDELIEISKKLMADGKVAYGYTPQAKQSETLVCNALEYIWGNGGAVFDGDKIVINSKEAIEGLENFKKVLKVAPEGTTTFVENDSILAFKEGRAAFMRNWAFAYRAVNEDDSKVKGNVGIAPLPRGNHGDKVGITTYGGWNLAINAYSEKKEAAWKFIEFVTSYDGNKVLPITSNRLPTVTALYSDSDVIEANPHFETFYDSFINGRPRPVTPNYFAISDLMQINFHKFLSGTIDAKTAIEEIEKGLQDSSEI